MNYRLILSIGAVLLPAPLLAQRPDLPPEPLIIEALDNHPAVLAARGREQSARAHADMLRRGNHEFVFQGMVSRRSVERDRDYAEYDVNLTRPFRLPGKAALDRKAGELGVEAAHSRMEDVRHQIALSFSNGWHDWLIASATHRSDRMAVALFRDELAAVRRRAELRDASLLEVDQAQSALAQAEAQAAASLAERDRARAMLITGFPGLALPDEAPDPVEPVLPEQSLESLGDLVIERSHEIYAADREAERLSALASRASADRIADPSFGIRVFSERGGEEKGMGLVGSIPLGGGYRRAARDQAVAEASAAGQDLARVRREIEAMVAADISSIRARQTLWSSTVLSASSADAAARRTQTGYTLGQIDLSEALLARRQANEARRQEIQARGDLLRAILKLQIDAHEVWPMDGDDHHEG